MIFLDMLLFVMYFTPSAVSVWLDSKDQDTVILVNLFFGWTIIGWFFALLLALRKRS